MHTCTIGKDEMVHVIGGGKHTDGKEQNLDFDTRLQGQG